MKKISHVILSLVVALTAISIPGDAMAAVLHYEDSSQKLVTYDGSSAAEELYRELTETKGELPRMPDGNFIPKKLSSGHGFNFRLWKDKGIAVYGTYNSVTNTFKEGYQTDAVHVYTNEGYYSRDGKRGEWRYHGLDANRNPYSNINFRNDANSGSELYEKEWIYAPWDSTKINPKQNRSSYNFSAINENNVRGTKTKEWINKTMPYTFRKASDDPRSGNPMLYEYINILSAPTIQQPGEGRMWHVSQSTGKLWYQTFTVPRQQPNTKAHLPVTCEITVKSQNPIKIKDYKTVSDSQKVDIEVEVTGELLDGSYFSDEVSRAAYYTRHDIQGWIIKLNNTVASNVSKTAGNKGKAIYRYQTTVRQLRENGNKEILYAEATPKYKDDVNGNRGTDTDTIPVAFTVIKEKDDDPKPPTVIIIPQEPKLFIPSPNVPDIAFDIVPFRPTDNTNMGDVAIREIFINGEPVEADHFFSGNYVFGENNLGFNRVTINYTSHDNQVSQNVEWVYVYSTKPNAQFHLDGGRYKQNRKMSVANTSTAGNIDLVLQHYPLVQYEWTFGTVNGDPGSLKIRSGTSTDMFKEFLYKSPGTYSITLRAKNTLGRWSDPYILSFEVFEDIKPAIEINLDNTVLARNETVSAYHYSISSTDGDSITSKTIELWYDSNNDGACEQKVQTYDNAADFPSYTPDRLGKYKFVLMAEEAFGEPALSEYITAADTVRGRYEVEFWVDNYVPLSDIYIDIPIVRPNIDCYVMIDANIDQTRKDYIINNRMTFKNFLLARNIIPEVGTWDMRTYVYSQPASTSVRTGGSYPSSNTTYSSNGYSGTLTRTSVSDNGYYYDYGYTATRTETRTFTGSWTNVVRKWGTVNPSATTGESSSPAPGSLSINQDGYSGSIPCTGAVCTEPYFYSVSGNNWNSGSTWVASYSGTLSKTVSYWVPDVRWVNDYTGYYSGTIYKNVREPYTSPFRSTSDKYILYVSDGNVSELSDLQMAAARSGAKIVLIGQNTITGQIGHEKFIPNNKPIEQVMNEAFTYVAENSPAVEKYYVLVGQDTFTMTTGNFDFENDSIVREEFQYVHNPHYFDNPTGMESFAAGAFSDVANWTALIINKFQNTGEFQIYRRVKDHPSMDPNFADYSYYSGATQINVYSHRKPIAHATLDWDFDASLGVYRTTWVDMSYDLDHQYSRMDKGIVDRKIMYRRSGGEWYYTVPDNLSPGTYELNYYVKDPEGVWSDPFVLNFTLAAAPPMQFDAKLRTADTRFSLSGIPASEYLQVYDAWTRYPYTVYLRLQLFNSFNAQVGGTLDVPFGAGAGTKSGNDISWNPILYQVPAHQANGSYRLRVTAMGEYGQSAYKDFAVTVNTPINLVPYVNGRSSQAEIIAEAENSFTMTTSKYVNGVQFTFKGTTFTSAAGQIILTGNDGTTKTWERIMPVPVSQITDGETGIVDFRATLPSGEFQTAAVDYLGIAIRAYAFTITSILDYSWRGYYFDLAHPVLQNGAASYPKKSGTDITSDKLPVNSLGLVPYTVDSIKAGYKVKGTIKIKGAPDSASFTAYYTDDAAVQRTASISLLHEGGELYSFSWIIPENTLNSSYIRFTISIRKGAAVYGDEKWYDSWAAANPTHNIFFVKGNVMEDIQFNQSH